MNLRWIPNAICLVRIALVPPVVLALLEHRYDVALLLFVIAGGSDGLDGFLARRFSWQSRLGALLDPLSDKLLVSGTFITLGILDLVPLGVVGIVVARDLVIVAGALTYHFFVAPVRGMPSVISKVNTAFQLTFVVFVIANAAFGWPPAVALIILGAGCVFSAIVSGLNYVLKWTAMALASRRTRDAQS